MTHDTREVEELYEKIDAYYRENFDESQPRKKMYIVELLHHQLQKARQDWLREEIMMLEWAMYDKPRGYRGKAFNEAFQTIIDRYHSELDQPTPWQCGKCTQERDGVKGDEIPEHHRSCKQRTELDQDNKYKIN